MRNHALFSSVALCFAGVVSAQAEPECPRGRFVLSSGRVTTSVFGFNAWKVKASKSDLPADLPNGIYPSAQVVHAIWPDANASGDNVWRYLRSVDGGWSWDRNQSQDIWVNNNASGETFDGGEIEFDVLDNVVSVVFTANRDTNGQYNGTADDYVWALVSVDQGQTWQSICVSQGMDNVLTTGDDLSECDEPVAALARVDTPNGPTYRLHVAFEADYDFAVGANAATGTEDIWYNAVDIDANTGALSLAFAEERRIDDANPTGTVDEDLPSLAAEGTVVAIAWIDDRVSVNGGMGGNNAFQNSYVRLSTDGGATLQAEVDTTQLSQAGAYEYRQPIVKLSLPFVFVISEDSRNLNDDDLFLSYSADVGQNWVRNIRVDTVPPTVDSDGKDFLYNPDNGEFFVSWIDDREGSGNADNDVRGAYGTLADFQNGTQVEVDIANTGCNHSYYNLDRVGSIYVQSLETGCGEDAAVAFSFDNGHTWEYCETVGGGNADTDDPCATITMNRDIVSVVQQDDGMGNNNNVVEVNGLRLPLLEDRTATNQGIRFRGGIASDTMDAAILFASLAPPTSLGFALPNGPTLNFTPDALTLATVGNVGLFLSFIDANGNASWPFPKFSTLLGQDIYYVVGSIDLLTNVPTLAFTDTIRQRP